MGVFEKKLLAICFSFEYSYPCVRKLSLLCLLILIGLQMTVRMWMLEVIKDLSPYVLSLGLGMINERPRRSLLLKIGWLCTKSHYLS